MDKDFTFLLSYSHYDRLQVTAAAFILLREETNVKVSNFIPNQGQFLGFELVIPRLTNDPANDFFG